MYTPDFPLASDKHLIRPAHGSFYAVAGRLLFIEAYERWASLLFDNYISGWRIDRRMTRAGRSPDLSLLLHKRSSSPPPVPAEFGSFEVANGGVCFTDGRVYYFRISDSTILLRQGVQYEVEVWPTEKWGGEERSSLARMAFYALMSAFRRVGLYELHGGAVVEPKTGAGVLFVGPSGSGKSTLTLQAASRGWRYLSDDSLLLNEEEGDVRAWALRREFALTDETVEANRTLGLKEVLNEPESFDPEKLRVEPEAVFPEGFAEVCAPRLIIFPRVTGERRSDIRSITQTDCMSRLVKMCPWATYDKPASRGHLSALGTLARRARAYELAAGLDIFDDSSLTTELIAERAAGQEL